MPGSKRSIPRREMLLTALLCLQTCWAIWGMALMTPWKQALFTLLSVVGIVICLVPSPKLDLPHSTQYNHRALRNLLSFPFFWAGLLLLGYMLVQALNPAFGYEEGEGTWRAFPIDHISWLPSTVDGPYAKLNAWRMMVILGGPWLLLCYAWSGIHHRRSLIFILWFTFFQALFFCVLAVAQKQSGAEGIYWKWEAYPNFFGTAPYKNRGATLLYLMMGSSMALYFYLVRAMHTRQKHSGPHLIVMLGILIQYAVLWTSFSRAAIAVGTVMLLFYFAFVIFYSLRDQHSPILRWAGVFLWMIIGVFSVTAIRDLPDVEKSLTRMGTAPSEIESGDWNLRGPVTRITLDMIKDRPWYGWGAGSWRFVFPYYLRQYPELAYTRSGVYRIWEDAHNDWAQYVSELGLVGTPLLAFFVLWPVGGWIWNIRRCRFTHAILIITFCGTILHGLIELLFQNSAILCFTALLTVFILKLPRHTQHSDTVVSKANR